MKRRFHLTFPEPLRREPVVYTLGKRFGVVPNIRRASIDERSAWMILELEGEEEALSEAISWLAGEGVQIDRLEEEP